MFLEGLTPSLAVSKSFLRIKSRCVTFYISQNPAWIYGLMVYHTRQNMVKLLKQSSISLHWENTRGSTVTKGTMNANPVDSIIQTKIPLSF